MDQYAVISDVHGNLYALEAVMQDMRNFNIKGIIFLGDLIDYGMQSNEVVDYLRLRLGYQSICNIWGNHEKAILCSDFTGFASRRGQESAQHTALTIRDEVREYLNAELNHDGRQEFVLKKQKCLAIHGSENDPFWQAIYPDKLNGDYRVYDIVFSGHSHYPHVFTKFYDMDMPERRNKKPVIFLNPGSVGQPRNHNPNAQYMVVDMSCMNVFLRKIPYNVDAAMQLFDGSVDWFYRDRLKWGV